MRQAPALGLALALASYGPPAQAETPAPVSSAHLLTPDNLGSKGCTLERPLSPVELTSHLTEFNQALVNAGTITPAERQKAVQREAAAFLAERSTLVDEKLTSADRLLRIYSGTPVHPETGLFLEPVAVDGLSFYSPKELLMNVERQLNEASVLVDSLSKATISVEDGEIFSDDIQDPLNRLQEAGVACSQTRITPVTLSVVPRLLLEGTLNPPRPVSDAMAPRLGNAAKAEALELALGRIQQDYEAATTVYRKRYGL